MVPSLLTMRVRTWKPAVIACALSTAAFSQPPVPPTTPAFEVASGKPADPKLGLQAFPVRGGPGTSDPGQVAYTNVSLREMLFWAYGATANQIAGPPWIRTDRYDIVAKIPPGTNKDQFTAMLRGLLAERFHLVLHLETKEVQGYALVVGRNGPKLRKSSEADSIAAAQPQQPPARLESDRNGYPQPNGPGMVLPPLNGSNAQAIHLIAKAQTVAALASMLGGIFGHPIVDKTSLAGVYDFTLDFALETAPPAQEPHDSYEPPPRIPVALQEQLGLRLEPATLPVDQWIVDSADKTASPN
jgi:uncharacterized protein (TIGR03435 family)